MNLVLLILRESLLTASHSYTCNSSWFSWSLTFQFCKGMEYPIVLKGVSIVGIKDAVKQIGCTG